MNDHTIKYNNNEKQLYIGKFNKNIKPDGVGTFIYENNTLTGIWENGILTEIHMIKMQNGDIITDVIFINQIPTIGILNNYPDKNIITFIEPIVFENERFYKILTNTELHNFIENNENKKILLNEIKKNEDIKNLVINSYTTPLIQKKNSKSKSRSSSKNSKEMIHNNDIELNF